IGGDADRRRHAGDVDVVLDGDRYAVERAERFAFGPPPVARRGLGQRRLSCDGDEDSPVVIGGGDAVERGADERHGAGPAGREVAGERRGVARRRGVHHASLRLSIRRIGFWRTSIWVRWTRAPGAASLTAISTPRRVLSSAS